MSSEMSPPKVPTLFQTLAFFKSVKPTLGSGAFYMTPKMVPGLLKTLLRWKFAVSGLIRLGAQRYPDRLALVDDYGELTYTELDAQNERLARALMDRGLTSKSAFGVIARNGRGIIQPMAVKGFTGAEIMLMNIGSSIQQIEGIIEQNNVSFLFIDDEFLDRAPLDREGLTIVVTAIDDPATRDFAKKHDNVLLMEDLIAEGGKTELEHKPEQGRIIIMSSGTTGLPKGVLRNEPKTPATIGAIADRIPWRRNLTVHQSASMFHAWGWANVIIAMVTGATLITMRRFDPNKMVDQCEKYQANAIISAAIFLRQFKDSLDKRPESKVGPFEFIVSSGNAIPGWLVSALTHRFGPVVCNFYGSTEAGVTSIASGPELALRPESAGRPTLSTCVRILDEDGKEVPRGTVGLLHTAQELSFIGYLNPKDKFQTVDGLFQIGDLARMDEEGYLYICGRADDMVIKGGENVFPREIEELLGPIPGIGDIYCRGMQNDEIVADLYLYIVRDSSKQGQDLTAEMLQDYCRENLADHSVPDKVFFVDRLPRNAVGKVVPREIDKMMGEH